MDFAYDLNSLKANGYLKSIDKNLVYVNGYGDIFYTNKRFIAKE